MTFNVGGFYAHEKFRDMFVEIVEVLPNKPGSLKLHIRWWNRSQTGQPYLTNQRSIITVDQDQLQSWQPFTFFDGPAA